MTIRALCLWVLALLLAPLPAAACLVGPPFGPAVPPVYEALRSGEAWPESPDFARRGVSIAARSGDRLHPAFGSQTARNLLFGVVTAGGAPRRTSFAPRQEVTLPVLEFARSGSVLSVRLMLVPGVSLSYLGIGTPTTQPELIATETGGDPRSFS